MRATGIVRRTDPLGRIVIPGELRRLMNIKVDDEVEISVYGEFIVLSKYSPKCIFCNDTADGCTVKDKPVCRGCLTELRAVASTHQTTTHFPDETESMEGMPPR